jgi:hypothetical protein
MFQAITTKYIGPTNYRGSRIAAFADCGRIYVGYDHALNIEDNHVAAAKAFAEKYGWVGSWYGGGVGRGFVFVCDMDSDQVMFTTDPKFPKVA